jgi:lysophospholipase L1-like esterase
LVGDSITEQKVYTKFIEMYLTVCQPQLEVDIFQFGCGGEWATGFLKRMDDDLKCFNPTVVTLGHGMNDGQYKPYVPAVGASYEKPMREIVRKLKESGTTVILGGPGSVDTDFYKKTHTAEAYNQNLESLSNIAKQIAVENGYAFAGVHAAMVGVMPKAKAVLGPDYDVCGRDGLHPNQNGHFIMAYAYLKAMGFDGNLGSINIDLKGKSTGSGGHEVISFADGEAKIESKRYPFCFSGDGKSSQSTASILPFLPFNADLNRLPLVVRNADSAKLKVTWGNLSKVFTKEELEKGVNLAAEFIPNPFNAAFAKVESGLWDKQNYETEMIKSTMPAIRAISTAYKNEPDTVAAVDLIGKKAFERWLSLNKKVKDSFKPLTHTIKIENTQ